MTAVSGSLKGRVVVVPESRELDLFVRMLEERGATAVRCPLIAIQDTPDIAAVEAWLRRFIAGPRDDLILLTGEGLRRLVGFARRSGIEADFVAALAKVRKVTRGPKPARALRELGLTSDLAAEIPTSAGVIAALSHHDLHGRTIGLQRYPDSENPELVHFLVTAGARLDPVLPYVYASAADDGRVVEIVGMLASGAVDVIAFTSAPQVRRLCAVAEKAGKADALKEGFARTKIASVGPVVAAQLAKAGVKTDIAPEGSFFMKPLVNAIVASFL